MAKTFHSWLRTLGAPEDPVATDTTSSWSAMSLLKAIYQAAADGTIGAAIAGRAEGFVAFCQSAVSQCAHYMRLARASRIAAAASAVTAANNAAQTTADAAASASSASINNFSAGYALLGQRTKKDRVAAAASAAAAAASAASVPSPEALVLPVQIYS